MIHKQYNRFLFHIGLIICLILPACAAQGQEVIDLKGTWKVRLDSLEVGLQEKWFNHPFETPIELPGTLDDAAIGDKSSLTTDHLYKEVLLNLTRKHSFIGPAWYAKEIVIPADWKQKNTELILERVIWNTQVWVDGQPIGSNESLSTPHRFDMSDLSPGKHLLVIRVDNRKQYDISYNDMAHAYTNGTQIIWNGIIGDIHLKASDKLRLDQVTLFPNLDDRSVSIRVNLDSAARVTDKTQLDIIIRDKDNKIVRSEKFSMKDVGDNLEKEVHLALGDQAYLWDEFTPNLYTVELTLTDKNQGSRDFYQTKFGLREIKAENNHILLNGRRIFLRGTLESNIFPLTGYPAMDADGWLKVFTTAKQYGLNHLRFHSWCPPKAAFEVADSLGFYLQVELPLWASNIGKDEKMNQFLETEANRIMKEYGNHPSFCLWALGNELQGDFNYMENFLQKLKVNDKRRLYTTTTFTFEQGHGTWPEPADDFFITQYTKAGWVRGQGVFNTIAPNFSTDYSLAVDSMPIPLITHEIGQYSVYPNLTEIQKYTGVLAPLNFIAIRNDLITKKLIDIAPKFTLASGKFAANLYKEEIERALKTKGISGFQLLDLHDFPGQGTALVGILDAFWDSKGLVSAEQHRRYSSQVVPLIRFPKVSYRNSESFKASIEVANFSAATLTDVIPSWRIKDEAGKTLFQGQLEKQNIALGNGIVLGEISCELTNILKAKMLSVEVEIKGTDYKNHWNIWVYPDQINQDDQNVYYTRSLSDALQQLKVGKKVLLNPDTAQILGVEGRFAPVFWSPVHFPDQPGTMGILCEPSHAALANFPTDFYSDWQWWDLISSSKTMIIDSLPAMQAPIVRVIDNFYKNRKMANIIEAKVGKGKLIIASVNISDDLEERLSARQLRYSLTQYMNSRAFSPTIELTEEHLKTLIKDDLLE